MESFSLGDTPELSSELLRLVSEGKKTGTSWAAVHGDYNTKVGEQMIITDHDSNPKFLVQTTGLILCRFDGVNEDFAKSEGEEDVSLEYWKNEHERYFKNEGTFSSDMMVYCQNFKVLKSLD